MGKYDVLTNAGWTLASENPNLETVAQTADACLQYQNTHTLVSFMPCTQRGSYLLKLAGSRGNDFNYLEIKSTNESALIEALNGNKDEVDAANYFGIYMKLQNDFDVSILAWEQWEKNYR